MEEYLKDYLKPVYTFAYGLVGDKHAAEDIAQDTFLKVWKNRKKFKPEQNLKTWILSIARNTAIDWLRKKKPLTFSRFETNDEENPLTATLADEKELTPQEFAAANETKEMLESVMLELPLHYREVLLLHYNEELSIAEISALLKRPIETVKSQHRRGIALLRKKLLHLKDIS
jgi:RNA polymerase sigma-70 factor (ECF subfamily)